MMTMGAVVSMVMTNEVAPSQREDSLILSSTNYVVSTFASSPQVGNHPKHIPGVPVQGAATFMVSASEL